MRIYDGNCDGCPAPDMGSYEFSHPGDLDGDCRVNLFDFSVFSPYWLRSREILFLEMDFDHSGSVDLNDLLILAENWLREHM
jgi:hypothetical protein